MARLVATQERAGCSICGSGSERRAAADALLVRLGEKDEQGERITWDYVLSRVKLITGKSTSRSSMRRHLANHCRRVEDGDEADEEITEGVELSADMESLLGDLDRALEGDEVSPIGLLEMYLRAGAISLRKRVAAGEEIRLTPDQIQRISSSLTKVEKESERTRLILAMSSHASRRELPETVPYEVVQELPEPRFPVDLPEEDEEGGEDA